MDENNSTALHVQKPATNQVFFLRIVLLLLLTFGLGIRLVDLKDPPLDFHPTRQLRAAIIARGMYYEMSPAADQSLRAEAIDSLTRMETYEPPIFERLVALTYLATGGESLWIARLYAILFWCAGGLILFDLARRLVSWEGGLATLAYYLLLPLAILGSRSFQPDPLVTFWIILTLWMMYFWRKNGTWKWALFTGGVIGITLLIKITAIFFVLPAVVILVLDTWGFRKAVGQGQVWLAAAVALIIPSIHYIPLIAQGSSSYISFWILSFKGLLLEPSFFVQWVKFLDYLFNLALLVAGIVGVAMFPAKGYRKAIFAMWLGYVVYGLSFSFQINTHEYYSLMFVPIVALSLAPIADQLVKTLCQQPVFWRVLAAVGLLLGGAYPTWITFTGLIGRDYSTEAAAWTKMGQDLPESGQIIALTHDYGLRIHYYGWRFVDLWPTTDDLEMLTDRDNDGNETFVDFNAEFIDRTRGMDYFLVTRFDQLEAQPELKARLYDNYAVSQQGDGYILFDLMNPLSP
jgi:hypothetical protein